MKPLALAGVLVVATAAVAHADRAITGTVVDDTTGKPIVAALVALAATDSVTDEAGTFHSPPDLPLGRLDVVVIADGYRPYFGSARVGDTLAIRLAPDASAAGEVIEVTGRTPTKPALHLGTDEIRLLPGAGNDALRALQSLPGVARTPFGLGGLALRGTAPRDTKVYLDGIEVPLLYHFGGLASFLPTDAVDEVELEPGGASVRYGRGLGGVALVTSRTGRKDGWRAGGEISLIHAAAIAEGPGPLDGSWLIAARRSYFDAIEQAANLDVSFAPRYGDAQLRWESGDGRWMAILFGSDDRLTLVHDPSDASTGGVDTSNITDFSYSQRFARLGLRYRGVFGATRVTILPYLGVDDVNARDVQEDMDKGLHRTTFPFALRADVATPFLGGTFDVGIDGGSAHDNYGIINTPPPSPADPDPKGVQQRTIERWTTDIGAFVEQSWFLAGDRLELRPGLRGDHFGLSDQWTLDPRLSLHEHLPRGIELSQSVGRYHEPPLVSDYDPVFMRTTKMLGSKATQFAATAASTLGDDKEISATAYYQDMQQLPVDAISGATPISANGGSDSGGALGIARDLVDSEFGSYSYREAIGTGHAYGLELIARKSASKAPDATGIAANLSGWVAYTYGRSFRKNPLRGDTYFPYVLDQPNTFTVVAAYALPRNWRAGGRFRYATGNPFTPVAGAYMNADGKYVAIDGPILSERLPAFWQLDLRVDHLWHHPWGWGGLIDLYLDVQNVTYRDNAEGVTYSKDYAQRHYTTGLPVFPSIGVVYAP